MLSLREQPILSLRKNPILSPPITVATVEAEMDARPHLAGDRACRTREVNRTMRDARQIKTAAAAIGALPGPTEAIHMAISGTWALFHVIGAALEMAHPARIEELTIATLSFSRRNIESLCALVDAGKINAVSLLCSHYFKNTTPDLYTLAETEFAKRPDRARFLSIRTHAKILAVRLTDGRTATCESSANVRSSKNCEQLSIFGDPQLYAFHRGWIAELFDAAGGRGVK